MALRDLRFWRHVETTRQYGLLASALGLAIMTLSSYAAFLYKFTHYYEPMLLGLMLLLAPFTPKRLLKGEVMAPLYIVFVFAGVLFDAIIVPHVVELWTYGYATQLEYVPLYLWIYPAGGFVMLQSFIVLDRILDVPKSATLPVTWPLAVGFVLSATGTGLSLLYDAHPVIIFGGLVVTGFFTREYIAQRRTGTSLLGKVYAAPIRVTGIILSVAVVNAILHEAPNTVAQQWVYHNIPLASVAPFGVPILVIGGWVFLVLAPVSWYYSDPLDILHGDS